MRHPICEKLLIDTEYVPINVKLGIDNEDGILLFGLNSAGKSTLQKSIGINIVLAQIGYFVAATQFNYYPYKSLMTRITSNDNLFKGLSSFALEISDLRAILKRSNENTLIIADEVCKGTEHQSSLIIVMTMLEILSKNKCSFITATHLHDITKLERLKQLSNIKLFHLHVEYDEQKNSLKYGRQLLEGSGEHFYGLNVAKYLINDNQFLTIANEIKLVICPDLLVGNKTSKYNSNVFINKCQICNYYPKNEYDKPLETHHINFQKNTDKNGFLLEKPHVHKNHKNNLCVLCFKCHDKIDTNEIVIYGYENNILQYKQCKQYKIESTTNKKNNTDFKMTIQILKDLKDKLSYIFQKYECKQLNILKDTFEKCI
jgi:DNA mismatch repair protein MutS